MQLSHSRPIASAVFDDPNLVSPAGLVPVMGLARRAGLRQLADECLSVPTDKGANPGLKVSSLVAGMVAGADSIDDMALLRHGGMSMVFDVAYAPSTLGSFLREFTFGHVRQADAVASRFLINLAEHTALLGRFGAEAATETVMVDIDDTIVEVHGYQKQGAGFGYSGVRGLNALLATVSTQTIAPVITAQRLRKGSVGSPRGASRLITDALALIGRTHLAGRPVLVRADSAFYSHTLVSAAMRTGAAVSVTVRMDPAVKRAIASIADDAWTTIKYTDAIFDQTTRTWVSKAQVAEVPFTAFTSKKRADQPPGDLVGSLLRGERGERDLGDLGLGDPGPGGLVEDRVGVLDRGPGVVGDACDRAFDGRVHPHGDRDRRAGSHRCADQGVGVERRVRAHQHRAAGQVGCL